MTDKPDTSPTIIEENIPKILRVCGEGNDQNLQDIPHRDIPKYLREQYWIKQSGPTKRWKNCDFANLGLSVQLRRTDLGRKLEDPGDAFFELVLSTSRSIARLRTWVEVTEVFLQDEQAKKVNRFIREYNGLRGKGEIDAAEFLKSLNFGPPASRLQREMADKVISAIQKKAQKGREGGSYRSLVHDYGRGLLIVGLPLWFATFPSDPTHPSTVLKDFVTRLGIGIEKIKNSVLLTSWCPFDSVLILWNPTLESIDEWTKVADFDFYSDPANLRWQTAVSFGGVHSLLREPDLPTPDNITYHFRWDRYPSLDKMLTDQRQLRVEISSF